MNEVLSEFSSQECGSDIEQDRRYPGAFSSDRPTPFEQSGSVKAADLGETLNNPRDPYYHIQHEKGVHRVIAYMHIRGDTNKEIAEAVGRSAVCISNVLRQPHMQVLIAEEVKKLGTQAVHVVLKGEALRTVQRLIAERDNFQQGSSQSRIAAANALLDRTFGKPNQPITHHDGKGLDDLTDEEIKQRLDELNSQKSN